MSIFERALIGDELPFFNKTLKQNLEIRANYSDKIIDPEADEQYFEDLIKKITIIRSSLIEVGFKEEACGRILSDPELRDTLIRLGKSAKDEDNFKKSIIAEKRKGINLRTNKLDKRKIGIPAYLTKMRTQLTSNSVIKFPVLGTRISTGLSNVSGKIKKRKPRSR